MPWSAKARELLRTQYAAVGASGRAALPMASASLLQAAARLEGVEREQTEALAEHTRGREMRLGQFVDAYRRYCWPVNSLDDWKLAPFHLLASEGAKALPGLEKLCVEDDSIGERGVAPHRNHSML